MQWVHGSYTLKRLLAPFSIGLLFLVLHAPAWGQRIESVAGLIVLISVDDLPFKAGQIWEILGEKGEKSGEIRIRQIKENKATGQIISGFAVPGYLLRLKFEAPEEKVRDRRLFVGLSLLAASLDVTLTSGILTDTARMRGNQFGLQLGVDQILTPRQLLRLRFGLDLVNTTGSIANPPGCRDTTQCLLWIHYFTGSLGFLFQLNPEGAPWNFGLNTGFVSLIPISKNSDGLDASKITMDGGFDIGLNFDVKINSITYVQLSAQQLLLRTTEALKIQYVRYNLTWIQYF